jgi:hypothetical protein
MEKIPAGIRKRSLLLAALSQCDNLADPESAILSHTAHP